jgi:site-specific recombinase XerD
MTTTNFTDTATGWQRALYAFLVEKEQHSGSPLHSRGLFPYTSRFLRALGKQPNGVTYHDVFVYAHGPVLSGKHPSAITIGARIACLSSFYRFLMRMDIVQSSLCDKLQSPKAQPSPPRGLPGDQVQNPDSAGRVYTTHFLCHI